MSDNILGTWIGILGQTDENAGYKEPVKIAWRIHSIDHVKKQVELTDMGQRIHDGSEIENPIRLKYNGTYRDSVFVIAFDKPVKHVKFTFKVKRNGLDDRLLLVGKAVTPRRHQGMVNSGKKYHASAEASIAPLWNLLRTDILFT